MIYFIQSGKTGPIKIGYDVILMGFIKKHKQAKAPIRYGIDLKKVMLEIEQGFIQEAIRIAHNNKSKAAMLLGISRPTLYDKL